MAKNCRGSKDWGLRNTTLYKKQKVKRRQKPGLKAGSSRSCKCPLGIQELRKKINFGIEEMHCIQTGGGVPSVAGPEQSATRGDRARPSETRISNLWPGGTTGKAQPE